MFPLKIIHIFDDDKFIDPAIKLFEEVKPNVSIYYVIKKNDLKFQYVKSNKVRRIDFDEMEQRVELYKFINGDINNTVFLHALTDIKQEITLNINPLIRKVWFIWGYDLYLNFPLLNKDIYLPSTKSILNVQSHYKTSLLTNYFTFFLFKNSEIIKNLNTRLFLLLEEIFNSTFYKSASLIDIVVPVVPTEYQIIKDMKLKAKYAPFTYGCIEDLLGDKINETVFNKPNILVGNSADPSNNHLDIFLKLSKLNLEGKKIYVPLGYSGNDNYKKVVIEEGFKLFKDNFKPLLNFMSLEKYNEILLSCGTLIFNHVRQQAVGNIIVMGYLGAKMYLNKKSPVYKYYKQEGITINNIDELTSKHFQQNYSMYSIATNKKLFYRLYSRPAVHVKITTLLEMINSNKK